MAEPVFILFKSGATAKLRLRDVRVRKNALEWENDGDELIFIDTAQIAAIFQYGEGAGE